MFYWHFQVNKTFLSLEICLWIVCIIVYNKNPGCYTSPYHAWYIKVLWQKCIISTDYLHTTYNCIKCWDSLSSNKTWQLYFLWCTLLTHREAIHIYDYKTDKTGLFNSSTKNAYHWTNTTYITMLHVYICQENLISLFTYNIQLLYGFHLCKISTFILEHL